LSEFLIILFFNSLQDKASLRRNELDKNYKRLNQSKSPAKIHSFLPHGILTPPASNRKSLENLPN
jgi:hypothetical protein